MDDAISLLKKKIADASAEKSALAEQAAAAEGEKAETEKTKAADEAFLKSLKTDCAATATAWEARQKDAAAEMAAIEKAKEILATGVTAMMQTATPADFDGDEDSEEDQRIREQVEAVLKKVGEKAHSYAMVEMVSAVAQDPFAKVKGLIEDMIAKLMESAAEEADHKAFCDEELGKSRQAKENKAMKMDKYRSRIDQA